MQRKNLCDLSDQAIIEAGQTIQNAVAEQLDTNASGGEISRRDFGHTILDTLHTIESNTTAPAIAALSNQIEFDVFMGLRFTPPEILEIPYDTEFADTILQDIVQTQTRSLQANLNQRCGPHI